MAIDREKIKVIVIVISNSIIKFDGQVIDNSPLIFYYKTIFWLENLHLAYVNNHIITIIMFGLNNIKIMSPYICMQYPYTLCRIYFKCLHLTPKILPILFYFIS